MRTVETDHTMMAQKLKELMGSGTSLGSAKLHAFQSPRSPAMRQSKIGLRNETEGSSNEGYLLETESLMMSRGSYGTQPQRMPVPEEKINVNSFKPI